MCSVRARPWATKYNIEVGLALGVVLTQVACRGFFQPGLLYISKARPASLPGSTSVVFLPLLLQVQQRDPCSVLRNSRNCWHSQPLEHETSANTGPKQVLSFCLKENLLLKTLSLLLSKDYWLFVLGLFWVFFPPDAEKKQGANFQSVSASALLKQQKQKLLEARKKRSEEIQRR